MDAILDLIGDILNIIWISLSWSVYKILAGLFNLFMKIASLDFGVSDTSAKITQIYQNITLLLTIIMTFYVTFEFIKYVIEPDKIGDSKVGIGSILKRIVISILLLAFTPKFFGIAYEVQNRIIEEKVIPKIIVGNNGDMVKSYGTEFTSELLGTFFIFDEEMCEIDKNGKYVNKPSTSGNRCEKAQKNIDEMINDYKANGNTTGALFKTFLQSFGRVVQFQGLLALAAGIYVCYVLVGYCIDVGTRWAQLLFLQLMAPIAIISYIAPKEDSAFKKWWKQCLTTYLDLFIRIAIMFFVLLLINLLSTAITNTGGPLVRAFLIVGLMRFAKQAPKMIKELFPLGSSAASIGFNPKETFSDVGKSFGSIKKPVAAATTVGKTLAQSKLGKRVGGKLAGTKLGRGIEGKFNGIKEDIRKSSVGQKVQAAANDIKSNPKLKNFASGAREVGNDAWSDIKAVYAGATEAAKTGSFQKGQIASQKSYQSDEKIIENGGTVFGHDVKGAHYQNVKSNLDLQIERFDNMTTTKKAVNDSLGEIKFRKQMDTVASVLASSNDAAAANDWQSAIKSTEKLMRTYSDYGTLESKTFDGKSILVTYDKTNDKTKIEIHDKNGKVKREENEGMQTYINKYEEQAQTIISEFNKKHASSVGEISIASSELEIDNLSKYSVIKDNIKEAKKAYEAISDIVLKDENGKVVKDENGKEVRFGDQFGKKGFSAADLGSYSDAAVAASLGIKTSSEYKEAKTNAAGDK